MASATIANPRELAERLDRRGGRRGQRERRAHGREGLPLLQPAGGQSRSWASARRISARRPSSPRASSSEKIATIVFAQSRLATEVLLATIKRRVEDKTGDSGIVRGYRGGYLPLRRREVEQGLRSGEVLGVVSTSALELGIDIGHLDVAVLAGLPGHHRLACGSRRAARGGGAGSRPAVLVATSSPMDQYLAAHPDYLFGAPPEHARINPENPFILVNHLKCARLRAAVRRRGEALRRRRAAPPGGARGGRAAPPRGRAVPLDLGDLSGRPHLAAHGHLATTSW